MDTKKVEKAQSQDEAREYAIQWQHWVGTQNLSWGELHEWQYTFEFLADKFYLVDEFKENGII